ncbi:hypothetical protein PRIC2_009868 [Phytophthora ramorum]
MDPFSCLSNSAVVQSTGCRSSKFWSGSLHFPLDEGDLVHFQDVILARDEPLGSKRYTNSGDEDRLFR